MKSVQISDHFFEGVISFLRDNGGWRPLRVKADEMPLHAEAFVNTARTTSGCRLRFATTSGSVSLHVAPDTGAEARKFDLTLDGDSRVMTAELPPGASDVHFDNLPGGRKVIEIWLPVCHEVCIEKLMIDDGAEADVAPDQRIRWVTYGSSITHCGSAHSPARTWPATAARLRGLNVTSLGYGGQCHMDPLVAMMIRDLAADYISLKVGINMVGGSVSERTYRPLLIGMVRIIREKHPKTPIVVISPIISPPREDTPGATGMTLRMMRHELQIAVERLRSRGDENVHYVSGLDLFGLDLVDAYLPDCLHPNGDGYEIMGRHFAEKVIDPMGWLDREPAQ